MLTQEEFALAILRELQRVRGLPVIGGGAGALSTEVLLSLIYETVAGWSPSGGGGGGAPSGPAGGDLAGTYPNPTISTAFSDLLPTADEKAALDAAPTPLSGANPVASMADIGGGSVPDPLTLVNGLLLGAGPYANDGEIKGSSGFSIHARNAADNADIGLIALTSFDELRIGQLGDAYPALVSLISGGTIELFTVTGNSVYLDGTGLSIDVGTGLALTIYNLPTADPVAANQVWLQNGFLVSGSPTANPFPATQINETGDPATLDIAAIADGQFLKRVGTDVVGGTGELVETGAGYKQITGSGYGQLQVTDDGGAFVGGADSSYGLSISSGETFLAGGSTSNLDLLTNEVQLRSGNNPLGLSGNPIQIEGTVLQATNLPTSDPANADQLFQFSDTSGIGATVLASLVSLFATGATLVVQSHP